MTGYIINSDTVIKELTSGKLFRNWEALRKGRGKNPAHRKIKQREPKRYHRNGITIYSMVRKGT